MLQVCNTGQMHYFSGEKRIIISELKLSPCSFILGFKSTCNCSNAGNVAIVLLGVIFCFSLYIVLGPNQSRTRCDLGISWQCLAQLDEAGCCRGASSPVLLFHQQNQKGGSFMAGDLMVQVQISISYTAPIHTLTASCQFRCTLCWERLTVLGSVTETLQVVTELLSEKRHRLHSTLSSANANSFLMTYPWCFP